MNTPNHVKMLTHGKLPMLTPDHIDRRSLLKGVTLGAGGFLFAPLLQKVAVARFTRTLGTLLSSGVAILESLKQVGALSAELIVI